MSFINILCILYIYVCLCVCIYINIYIYVFLNVVNTKVTSKLKIHAFLDTNDK